MQDEQANQIIQHLSRIEQVLEAIANALNRMAPPKKRRKKHDEMVYLPRVEPESPPPPALPPIIKSRRDVMHS